MRHFLVNLSSFLVKTFKFKLQLLVACLYFFHWHRTTMEKDASGGKDIDQTDEGITPIGLPSPAYTFFHRLLILIAFTTTVIGLMWERHRH